MSDSSDLWYICTPAERGSSVLLEHELIRLRELRQTGLMASSIMSTKDLVNEQNMFALALVGEAYRRIRLNSINGTE